MDILKRCGMRPVWLLLVIVLGTRLLARAATAGEYDVKAAFVFNFAKFVEWPPGSFTGVEDSIHICVVGGDPFNQALEKVVEGKLVQSRRLQVLRLGSLKEAAVCHILFIARNGPQAALPHLPENRLGTLTVGESEGFARGGGVINFVLRGDRIGFEINVDAARRAHLQISSKLLNLATIVHDGVAGGN